jgi:type II pantothenate kinase
MAPGAGPALAAIDFGISNTDVVARMGGELRHWNQPYAGDPDAASVRAILAAGGVDLDRLEGLAVTGGRHKLLPPELGRTPVVAFGEVDAIGRGGQAILGLAANERATPTMVVSAGSGTALILAAGSTYAHVSGTGVGGGTMLGLARLLLDTLDPNTIGELALAGDRNGADLSLADVITGPIGALPADATAVNFGRLGRRDFHGAVRREDLAAAIVNLVAQTIGLVTVNAAKAHGCARIVVIGHMLDMPYFRHVLGLVGKYYATDMLLPAAPGCATALGALELLESSPLAADPKGTA